ncbi:MAG: beta-lactamase family protein [Chloroflexi bacterium]|nr:beta-lactamase family protein [Chloroflexota bacterium]MCC6894744.1 beta-lactamase family protein [Anaerolineae bacterium]
MNLAQPESAGMSSDRLQCINALMENCVTDNQLPGILTLVQRHGKVVHLGKFGAMDIAANKPMQEDALFRIYSMTKPITSLATMILLEEGRFNIFDPVSNFIPAFAKTKVYDGMSVSGMKLVDQQPAMNIQHLLTHTAGLSYGSFFDSPVEELYRQSGRITFTRNDPLESFINRLAEFPLLFQPGTNWRYSLATDVLGYLVQVVADMPLGDFLQERIFKPLGMTDTAFTVPADKVSRLAQIYTSKELYNITPVPPAEVMGVADVTTPTQTPLGGAGLVSTLADYLTFCNMLLNKGAYEGGRLVSRKTIEWMTANHIPASIMPIYMGLEQRDHGFGLGFRVTVDLGQSRRLSSVGEFGWGGAANTYFWVDPAEDFIGLMMTQHLPLSPYPFNDLFRNLAYQAIID